MEKILIYGGNGAVGSALARILAEEGYPLHLAGRNEEALEALGKELGASWTAGDVREASFHKEVAKAAGKSLGGLVYAVGSINLKSLRRLEPVDYLEDFQLNAMGAALAVKENLGALKAAPGGSSVVLVSSIAARKGFPMHASLSMAKAAVEGLVVALGAELAPGIRVNGIAPSILAGSSLSAGILKSEESLEAMAALHPLKRLGGPQEIAQLAAFLLSPKSPWITGQILGVDGGRSTLIL